MMGVIFYGSSADLNLQMAYDRAIQHMDNNNVQHIKANTHPDFMLVRKSPDELQVSIDLARQIKEFSYKQPTLSTNKAIILHNIEDFSIAAMNSLLKVLEEPPTNVEFILTTKHLLNILPTIRSRCLKIKVTKPHKDCYDVKEFIGHNIDNIPNEIIELFVDYLEKDRTINVEFAKNNAEYVFEFIDVAIHFLSYNQSVSNANKILVLQELRNIASNTYPDKQNLLLSAMYYCMA